MDAINGKIVKEYSNIMEAELYGYITGNYYPIRVNDPTANSAYSTTNIKMYNVYGQLVATLNTDANGYYYKGGIAYTGYYLQVPLENSWIKMRNDADRGNPIKATISTLPGRRDYDWSAGDGTNVRWHASRIHDFFKSTPLNYSGMDYQMEGHINSVDQYGYPYNGAADGTNIYFGTQSGQYWARSSDVVYHEYTHNTIYHVYSGWIGSPSLYYIEASAMDEGLSDYFACTINNDAIQGEDVGVNRNLDNNTFQWTDYMGAHWNGQVIGGACWDLRQAIGQSVTDNLVFKAMQMSPHARSFSDFLHNMLILDNSTFSGAYHGQIITAFSNHGISTQSFEPTVPQNVQSVSQSQIQLSWTANPEPDVIGYEVWRSINSQGGPPGTFSLVATVTTNSFLDYDLNYGGKWKVYYKIKAKNTAGLVSDFSNMVTVSSAGFMKQAVGQESSISTLYSLKQNFPNPFNPSTYIGYQIPDEGLVKLIVFDVLGREVETIVNELKTPSYYTATFDASSLPSGIYLARISVTSNERKPFVQTIKMLLTK